MALATDGGLSIPIPTGRRLFWALFLNSQLLVGTLYVLLTAASVESLRLVAYAAIWINVAAWVVVNSRPDLSGVSTRTRRRGLLVGTTYFGLLAFAGGLVGAGIGAEATGLRFAPLPPGYGPALLYSGERVTINLIPNYLIGYAALAYLVYVTVIDAAGSAAAGLLGLFSCVSCSWPIVVSLASAVTGSGSLLVASALQVSYGVSTAVFLLTAGLLYWRPTIFARFRLGSD
ncbi:hypothetical protein EGH24_01645 [Halonotius terrestris]|uniref:Uncharacterized protein n=1 Tax=Halonotius terrestris TaxID=2487750 RepID=A0A8J8PE90_9EURY|nr:hypothetical protein [Halonotius terrestris]TQQ83521.1 hypothetical protein EGH24_01645 [Halonotius terrestris]